MNLLTIVLLLASSGSAETGNPLIPFTDEEQIKIVISTLEDGLLTNTEPLITSRISNRTSIREMKMLESDISTYLKNARSVSERPLVSLQSVEVKINDNRATVSLEAFTYGNGKRIKAEYKVGFLKVDDVWLMEDAQFVDSIVKQIGGVEPVTKNETTSNSNSDVEESGTTATGDGTGEQQ